MMALSRRLTFALSLAAAMSTALLSGCADGVELNGKVFDVLGVSPAALAAQKREPKMAARAPLVLPPDVNRLPEPGSAPVATAAIAQDPNWPVDPEQKKAAAAKERERLHAAYCRGEIQWKERALSKDESAPRSPFGPCPGLFGGLTEGLTKK